ncbi:MAG: methionyl-tRNA formyltransferase [Pseudomonadota bacterium]
MMLRVVFMGTPDFSVPSLNAIADAGHDVVAVYSQPPRAAGRRGLAETPSAVHRSASERGFAVHTPTSLKSDAAQTVFASHDADVGIVVAYGLILPKTILDAPKFGCLNLHASLLPRWRGAAPIQRAIMAGDTETGAMVMQMDVGLDTGPVALTHTTAIDEHMTAGQLHDALAIDGAALLVEALSKLEAGGLLFAPQTDDGVTYASKIDKRETRIRFDRLSTEVHNQIRGLAPFPGAWFAGPDGARVKVLGSRNRPTRSDPTAGATPGTVISLDPLTIACANGGVDLVTVQKAGKKPMSASEFLRGNRLEVGTDLSSG